ncbi:MAG: GAF domain-containing protein [Noviherbaspirillum sp.]
MPFASLEEMVAGLLASLQDFLPMRLWMVGRLSGGLWTVIGADDRSGRITAGAGFCCNDAFCKYIATDRQPSFIEDASLAQAPPAPPGWSGRPLQAYIGYPQISHRKEVLATLCGADEERHAPFTHGQQRLVAATAKTIGLLLAHSSAQHDSGGAHRQLNPFSEIDRITGLPNLQAWKNIIEQEEAILMQDAENALVAIAEVQDPDEEGVMSWPHLNARAFRDAALLRRQLRASDTVARVGVNRYALLMRRISAEQAQQLFEKIRQGFSQAGLAITLGCAMRLPCGSLAQAVRMADIRMYNEKLRRDR